MVSTESVWAVQWKCKKTGNWLICQTIELMADEIGFGDDSDQICSVYFSEARAKQVCEDWQDADTTSDYRVKELHIFGDV